MSAITPAVGLKVGQSERAMFLRHDEEGGQSVLQLRDNTPAYMSFYDMSDDTFETITPGTYLYVVVVRLGAESNVLYAVVEELQNDATVGATNSGKPPYESHRLNQGEEEQVGRTVYRRTSP